MSDATERKLEWACREIGHLCKEVSMLKNPEFWAKEAARRAAFTQEILAWSAPIWPFKVWQAKEIGTKKYKSFGADDPHEAFRICFEDAMKEGGPRNLEVRVTAPGADQSDPIGMAWFVGWREPQQ